MRRAGDLVGGTIWYRLAVIANSNHRFSFSRLGYELIFTFPSSITYDVPPRFRELPMSVHPLSRMLTWTVGMPTYISFPISHISPMHCFARNQHRTGESSKDIKARNISNHVFSPSCRGRDPLLHMSGSPRGSSRDAAKQSNLCWSCTRLT